MPIALGEAPQDERLDALLRAAATPPPEDQHAVVPCPFAKKKEEKPKKKKKKPIRMALWNIFELGGGYFMPSVRPQYAIDAYTTLLGKLDLHVIVLAGLTRTIQEIPTKKGFGASAYIALEQEPKDTGVTEAQRLLQKLQGVDGGAGWQMTIPKKKGTSDVLYQRWSTSAILHASAKGVNFQKTELVATSVNEDAGLTGTVLAVTFDAPDYQEKPVCVMTSLGTTIPERPWEKLRTPAADEEIGETVPMPNAGILFLSSPGDAGGALSDFQGEVDAEFLRPGVEGTVLGDEFWKIVSETRDGLLDNFSAVNQGNVKLQDKEMHWEALKDPEHIQSADKLPGYLADSMTILHQLSSPPPQVKEMRVVDLIAASLAAESIDKLKARPLSKTAKGGPPPENSVLVAQRKTYRQEATGGPEPEDDPINELSECGYFTRVLSRHWPIVAELQLEPESTGE